MKVFTVNLNKDNPKLENAKELEIIALGDSHIGDPLFNRKEFLKAIEYIRNTDNCYCILNGDLINNATTSSVSDTYTEEMTPTQQINYLVDILEPIKDKILVATTGNHCLRSFKESGIDIMSLVMRELGLKNRYSDGAYYIFLYFGSKERGRKAPMCYTIYGKHGNGGGSTAGGKINKLIKMAETCYADLYVMSHMHQPIATSLEFYLPDYGNKALILKRMYFLMSNSFLDFGGYGENFGLRPSSKSIVKAVLSATERKIKIEL